MIVLHTQSNEQKPNKRWKSHRQLLCPIGARAMYALMKITGCLHNTCGYGKGRQGDYVQYRLALYIEMKERQLLSAHCMHMIIYRLPFMYSYKYIDQCTYVYHFTIYVH